jgi:NADPH2:quinone reductase
MKKVPDMTHAIRIHETGGPEVLKWEEVDVPGPGPDEARVRQTAAGLNFIDVYHRTGLYSLGLPSTIGMEGAGVVEEVGEDVTDLKPGDRVAYADLPVGAYAEARVLPAHRLVPLPDTISNEQAAGMMLQGMTAEYLICRTHKVESGQTVLVHAAAGGVGLIACQWLKLLGAIVIGTVGSDAKAELARDHGCDHPIIYTHEDFVARVREITNGRGVPVVYDSVGKNTFEGSLDCLSPRGMLVLFGQSSGPVSAFDTGLLAQKGSHYLTRPTLMTYNANRADLLASAQALFTAVANGVRVEINQTFPLRDAAAAHQALESRKTTGSTILTI